MRRVQLFIGVLLIAVLGAVGCVGDTPTGLPTKQEDPKPPPPDMEGLRVVSSPPAYWLA